MKNRCLLIGVLAIGFFTANQQSSAQLLRGRLGGGGGGYYDDGGWASAVALASSNAAYSNRMDIANQDRLAAQQANAQQSAALQGSLRNTAMSQAQDQYNAIAQQRQSYRDWWFQTEQRQASATPVGATSAAAPMSGGYGMNRPVVGGLTMEDLYPDVHLDIIKWPRVLQEREFATRRAQIEAPYRRSPPGLSVPTAADYRMMVKTADEMKAILEWRLGQYGGLPTADYEQAKAFLNNLAREAQQRAEQAGGSSAPGGAPMQNTVLPESSDVFTL
jgi:hypothetical protein